MRRLGIGVIAIVATFSAGVLPASAQVDGEGNEGSVTATLSTVCPSTPAPHRSTLT